MLNLTDPFEKLKSLKNSDKLYLSSSLLFCLGLILWFGRSFFTRQEEVNLVALLLVNFSIIFFAISFLYDIKDLLIKLYRNSVTKIILWAISPIISIYSLIEVRETLNKSFAIDPSYFTITTSILTLITIISRYLDFVLIVISSIFLLSHLEIFLWTKHRKPKFLNNRRFFGLLALLIIVFIARSPLFFIAPNKFLRNNFPIEKFYSEEIIQDLAIYCDFHKKHRCTNPKLKNEPVIFLEDGFVLSKKNEEELGFEILNKSNLYKKFTVEKCFLN